MAVSAEKGRDREVDSLQQQQKDGRLTFVIRLYLLTPVSYLSWPGILHLFHLDAKP
jgi:hypothetical protein